jgi:hypothetical protein
MATFKDIDEIASREANQIKKCGGYAIRFYAPDYKQGQGSFTIEGRLNNASLEYRTEYPDRIDFTLKKDGDTITVSAERNAVNRVQVNDRHYLEANGSIGQSIENLAVNMVSIADEHAGEIIKKELGKKNPDKTQESAEAIEFGKNALNAVTAAIELYLPGALKLIDSYYTRSIVPPEQNPNMRTNAEIFEKFGF